MAAPAAAPAAFAVKAMERFIKVIDARSNKRGIAISTVVSSETSPDAPAINPDTPDLRCTKCPALATHISSFYGAEKALCPEHMTRFSHKWDGAGKEAANALFVLTLAEVRAVDAAKPRVRVTATQAEMVAMIPDTMGVLDWSSVLSELQAFTAASASSDTLDDLALGSFLHTAPCVRIRVEGCACCKSSSKSSLSTLGDMYAALLVNRTEDYARVMARQCWDKWRPASQRRIGVYWTNESGGVMHVAAMDFAWAQRLAREHLRNESKAANEAVDMAGHRCRHAED